MKRSGFEDPEQQQIMTHIVPRHHLHDPQKLDLHVGVLHHSRMLTEGGKLTLDHSQAHIVGGDRLEGEVLTSNRQKAFQEAAASTRHGCLEEVASAWRGPKRRESTALLEAFRDPTQRPDLVISAKVAGELSDENNMGLSTTSDLHLPGNLSLTGITCRICNKRFPSGRALGGHMRVHGPLFAPASTALSRSYGATAANLTHAKVANECDVACDEEEDVPPSIIDALDAAELEKDLPLQDARSAEATSGQYGADEILDHDNGYAGELDALHADSDKEKDLNSDVERRFVSLVNYNSRISHLNSSEEARIEANPTARTSKSILYKLRHNPKRSRWFSNQEFAFEASIANSSGKNFPPVEGGNVCSECGKAFWSERALFGHMRCHSDRNRRIAVNQVESISSEQPVDTMARQGRKLNELVAPNSEMQIGSKKAKVHRKGSTEMELASREFRNEVSSGIEVIGSQESADKTEGDEGLAAHKEQSGCISSSMVMDDEVAPARWRTAGRRSRRNLGVSKSGTMECRATSSSSPEDEPALTSETISLELGAVEEQEIQTADFLILLADAARQIEEETELTLSVEKSSLFRADVKRSKHQQIDGADQRPHSENLYVGEHEDVPSVQVTGMGNVKYECITCKKSFNSHQALGGHRASHKKTKGCFARTGSSEASEEQSLEEELELRHVQEKGRAITHKKSRQQTQQIAAAFKGHACSICHRIFLTGQALGGHKRCHWTGEKPSEAASIASTNKQSEGQSVVEGGIDLNMPAPMDEDDEVGFVPTEMHSIKSEIIDQDREVDEKANMDSSDLALGTSALAWAVKDLFEDDLCRSSPRKETEVRHRFDEIWGQHWPNNIGVTQLRQPMYAMQSLL